MRALNTNCFVLINTRWWQRQTMAQTKVAIVTGANKGIGFAVVRKMCKEFSGDVILASRDEWRGRAAVTQLEGEGLHPKFHQLDIDSRDSITALKQFVEKSYGGLDVLINNAAMAYKVASTAPFIEQATNTVKTNFTGTVNVTRALLPLMRPGGRIVMVSSSAGRLGILKPHLQEQFTSTSLTEAQLVSLMDQFVQDVANRVHQTNGWPTTAYGVSKVGVTAFTKVIARELSAGGHTDILVNACCPGWVRTDMAGPNAPRTPDQGAETPVYLAMLPPNSPSGEFWRDNKIASW